MVNISSVRIFKALTIKIAKLRTVVFSDCVKNTRNEQQKIKVRVDNAVSLSYKMPENTLILAVFALF